MSGAYLEFVSHEHGYAHAACLAMAYYRNQATEQDLREQLALRDAALAHNEQIRQAVETIAAVAHHGPLCMHVVRCTCGLDEALRAVLRPALPAGEGEP